MRERIAVGLGLVLVAAVSMVALSDSAPRRSGTNATVRVAGSLVSVAPGRRLCQPGQMVPKNTAALRVFFRFRPSSPGGPVDITVGHAGRLIATGHLPGGLSPGSPRVPIARIAQDTSATVCFANRGTRTIQFAGNLTPEYGGNNPGGAKLPDVVRIDYTRPGPETWWTFAPVVAERFALVKSSFVGSWTLYAALGAFALLCGLGIGLMLRGSRS
ncbi:MAG: hypothetical protein M3Z33_05480 [Actinomycetota bacterium]|nr:hypothetical protein [Actinomycetota bacterium]